MLANNKVSTLQGVNVEGVLFIHTREDCRRVCEESLRRLVFPVKGLVSMVQ